jgi:hypothetical protein
MPVGDRMRRNKKLTLALLCVCLLSMGACTFGYKDEPNGPAYVVAPEPTVVYYDMCYEEPYWHEPLWCDLYSDVECCTWYIDGWYEEWCDWGYMDCWEYYGSY